ncbi:hypothetical protein N7517_002358 [Penicillium concentricum]|uniref:F-box domain-containing protein n=1 Tax=Penicillium concentricum TaxID=293559 RepID=A0A9W9VJQ5_9EURO|nr:uncharacterized protein N7517_002358 [Penicillium concentricum]KAJ5384447.1 hypothetical protein N7517_002358 [Penicillium concentricum]
MSKIIDSSEVMTSRRYVHLPTEVLIQIARFISADWRNPNGPFFQVTLQRFCAVSRQWYSAGIEFLYYRPQLDRGNSFSLFTNTVCPSIRSRERKADLGSFVHILNLGRLVHHSSNSLTARLLGRVKKNLKTFVAPRVSFAINSLAPLAKCKNLSYLCLDFVAEPIPLSALKKAISGLDRLITIKLSSSMFITDDGSPEDWPPNLSFLQVAGRFDIETMSYFRWPSKLVGLTFCGCENLDTSALEEILINEQLCTTLQRLTIHRSNREMFEEGPSEILSTLIALKSLRIPVDLLYDLLILPMFDSPISIRELELTEPYDEQFPAEFDAKEFCEALNTHLSRVCYIGLSPGCLRIIPEALHAKIDKRVWKNIDKCSEEELDSLLDMGVVVMDREPVC